MPSLEIPVVLIALGLGATEAVLEELGPRGACRLRALRFFSPGTKVHFGLTPPAGEKVYVFGRILGYGTKGQRFIYHVALESIDEHEEQLTALVDHRTAQLAGGHRDDLLADTIHPPPLARASIRVEADFELEYRVGEAWKRATAGNLSVGGLLMRAHETLAEGMAVEVCFTLPSAILERCSHDAVLSKLWDRAVREAAQAMLRRPFKQLTLRARVVCHRSIARTIVDYGMQFCEVDATARAEIERYCAALHLTKTAVARDPYLS